MNITKSLVALLLAFAALCISPVTTTAVTDNHEDCNHVNCTVTPIDANVFDWSDYKDILFIKDHQLRVNKDLESEINQVILNYLVANEIIPVSAYYLPFVNEDIFIRFIECNVEIEYFSSGTREYCCPAPGLVWEVRMKYAQYNTNGWCISHCHYEEQVCASCRAVWAFATHKPGKAGCGHHGWNTAYQLCALSIYRPYGCSTCGGSQY